MAFALRFLNEIELLLEIDENEARYNLRRHHRTLRDSSNPFAIPEARFCKLFRLSRELALEICAVLEDYLRHGQRSTFIPNHLKVLLALYFYSHGSYQNVVADGHVVTCSQPTASRIIKEVTGALINCYLQNKIVFRNTPEAINTTKLRFFNKYQFPNVIGCIDCTHVAIICPPIEHNEYPGAIYFNRKGYTSLNVQIICDSDLKILAINARYPGSTHDAAIWQTSEINRHLQDKYLAGDRNTYLLGDSGYPLQPWLLTPIIDAPEHTPQGRYTSAHCKARNTIERLNGVLKGRFRCLLRHRTLHYSPPNAGRIIYACAILHNLCLERNIYLDEDLLQQDDAIPILYNNEDDAQNRNFLLHGRRIRDEIINFHFT